jgi:hypothetical protein
MFEKGPHGIRMAHAQVQAGSALVVARPGEAGIIREHRSQCLDVTARAGLEKDRRQAVTTA